MPNKLRFYSVPVLICPKDATNIEIMPEVKLGPEAQPRDANNRVVLFLLDT